MSAYKNVLIVHDFKMLVLEPSILPHICLGLILFLSITVFVNWRLFFLMILRLLKNMVFKFTKQQKYKHKLNVA